MPSPRRGWHGQLRAGRRRRVGASIVVLLAIHWPVARGFLESRPSHWLGKRSFSLYLVHEPILIAIVFALGGHPDRTLTLVTAILAALVVADLFHRAVEAPSLRLSRLVGRRDARPIEVAPGSAVPMLSQRAAAACRSPASPRWAPDRGAASADNHTVRQRDRYGLLAAGVGWDLFAVDLPAIDSRRRLQRRSPDFIATSGAGAKLEPGRATNPWPLPRGDSQ